MTKEPNLAPHPTALAPRWMKIVLAVSLAANLAVAGVVIGAVLKDGPPRHLRMARDLAFGPYTEALTKEDREALRQAFVQAAPEFADQRRALRADAAALLEALRATPYDQARVQAMMEAQHGRAMQRFDLGRRLLFDRITQMTPEARAAFADRLEDRLNRGPGKDRAP